MKLPSKQYIFSVFLMLTGSAGLSYSAFDFFYTTGTLVGSAIMALPLLSLSLLLLGTWLYQKATHPFTTTSWQNSKPTAVQLSSVNSQVNLQANYIDLDWLCHFSRTHEFASDKQRKRINFATFTEHFAEKTTLNTIKSLCPNPPEDRVQHLILAQSSLKSRSIVELISNAIDASQKHTTLPQVDVSIQNGKVMVIDQGDGMSLQDIYRKLILLRQSSKDQQKGAIGRFGVGFFTSLIHLKTEQDAVIVDTKADNCPGYRVIFRFVPEAKRSQHASAWACRVEANPNLKKSGTKVTVISADIEQNTFLDTTKHYFKFHQDANIVVNKQSIKQIQQYKALSDEVLVKQKAKEKRAKVQVTVAGIVTESLHTLINENTMHVAWQLPKTTRLLHDRVTVIVDSEATANTIKNGIDKVNDFATFNEKLRYLNSIAPMVDKLQQQNNVKGDFNLINHFCQTAKDIIQDQKCVPNQAELLPLHVKGNNLVHPLLLKQEKWQEKIGATPKEWHSSQGVRCYVVPMLEQGLIYDKKENVLYLNDENYNKIIKKNKNYDCLNSALVLLPEKLQNSCSFAKPIETTIKLDMNTNKSKGLSSNTSTQGSKVKLLQRFKVSKNNLEKFFSENFPKPGMRTNHLLGPYKIHNKIYYFLRNKNYNWQFTPLDQNFKRVNIYNRLLLNTLKIISGRSNNPSEKSKLQRFLDMNLVDNDAFNADDIERINNMAGKSSVIPLTQNTFSINGDIYSTADESLLNSQEAQDNLAWLKNNQLTQFEHARCAAFIHLPHKVFIQIYPEMQKLKHVPINDEIKNYQAILKHPNKASLLYVLDELYFSVVEYLPTDIADKIIALYDEYGEAEIKAFASRHVAFCLKNEAPRTFPWSLIHYEDLCDGGKKNIDERFIFVSDKINEAIKSGSVQPINWAQIDFAQCLIKLFKDTNVDTSKLKEMLTKRTGYISGYPLEHAIKMSQKNNLLPGATLTEKVMISSLLTNIENSPKSASTSFKGIKAPDSAQILKLSECIVKYSTKTKPPYTNDALNYAKRTLISAIYHQADPNKALYIRELIQNAIDSVQHKQGDKHLHLNLELTNTTDGPRCKLTCHDQGAGMSEDTLDRILLRPNVSSKPLQDNNGNKDTIGGFGLGFFTALDECRKLLIETSTNGKRVFCRELAPIYNEQNRITDVEVKKWSYTSKDFKGTRVTRLSRKQDCKLEILKLRAATHQHAQYIDPKTAIVHVNDNPINSKGYPILLEHKLPNVGHVKVYETPKSAYTAGGLFVKDITSEQSIKLAPPLQKLLKYSPMLIDLPKQTSLIGNRNDFSANVKEQLEKSIPSLLLLVCNKLYQQNRLPLSVMEYDFVSNNFATAVKSRSPLAWQDAKELARTSNLSNVKYYDTEQKIADLICYLPAVTYKNETYSLMDLTKLYHKRRISPALRKKIDEVPALKRQFALADHDRETDSLHFSLRNWAKNFNIFYKIYALIKFGGPFKEWLPVKRDQQDIAWVFFTKLSTQLVATILPNCKIKIGYSTTGDTFIAYTRQASGIIYWSPNNVASMVRRLCNALNSNNEKLFNSLVVEMTDTLTHECTHINESPCNGTHNEEFNRKLAQTRMKLAGDLDRAALFVEYKGYMNIFKEKTKCRFEASSAETFVKAQLLGVVGKKVASEKLGPAEQTVTASSKKQPTV